MDTAKIGLVSQNHGQNNMLPLSISYEMKDTSVATVDSSGLVTANAKGRTRLKIIDSANELETYVYIKVIDGLEPLLTTGLNFTVALKQNGTVWSFGKNDLGQLGSGDNVNKNEPVAVKCANSTDELKNIKQISSGYYHSVALSDDGKIYTWGSNAKGQLGNGSNTNSNFAVEVQGLNNIIKVEACEETTIALDKEGNVWAWGEGYSILPMKLISSHKMVDVSRKIFLSTEGLIYQISDLENRVNSLSRIAKISSGGGYNGSKFYLALTDNGYVYSWGDNTYGQLAKTSNSLTAPVSSDAYEISAVAAASFVRQGDRRSLCSWI